MCKAGRPRSHAHGSREKKGCGLDVTHKTPAQLGDARRPAGAGRSAREETAGTQVTCREGAARLRGQPRRGRGAGTRGSVGCQRGRRPAAEDGPENAQARKAARLQGAEETHGQLGTWKRRGGGGGGRGSAGGARAKGSAPQVPRLRPLARSWDMGHARRRWQNSRRAAASRGGSPRPACAGRRPRGRDGVRLPGLCRREARGMPWSRANTVEAARETGGHGGTSGGPGAMT